jgi:hypothetical protein
MAVAGGLVGFAVSGGLVGFVVSGGLVDAKVADGSEVSFSGVGVEDANSVFFTSLVSSEITGAAVAVREELLVPTFSAKIIGVFVLV